MLTPGRVVVLDTRCHRNTLAVILQGLKDKRMKVLILCDASKVETNDDKDDLPRPVTERYLNVPVGRCSQLVLSITVSDIAVVSSKVIKISADKIIDDVRKREQPRFK